MSAIRDVALLSALLAMSGCCNVPNDHRVKSIRKGLQEYKGLLPPPAQRSRKTLTTWQESSRGLLIHLKRSFADLSVAAPKAAGG